MRDPPVPRGRGDVFELDIHIVLGCTINTLAGNEPRERMSANDAAYLREACHDIPGQMKAQASRHDPI